MAKTRVDDIMSHVPTERGAKMGSEVLRPEAAASDVKKEDCKERVGAERKRLCQERFRR